MIVAARPVAEWPGIGNVVMVVAMAKVMAVRVGCGMTDEEGADGSDRACHRAVPARPGRAERDPGGQGQPCEDTDPRPAVQTPIPLDFRSQRPWPRRRDTTVGVSMPGEKDQIMRARHINAFHPENPRNLAGEAAICGADRARNSCDPAT